MKSVFQLIQEPDPTKKERYVCPNLCQATDFESKKCGKCGSAMEYMGFLDETETDKELSKRQTSWLARRH